MIIKITSGESCLIDDEDYSRITTVAKSWYIANGYAACKFKNEKNEWQTVSMHRIIMNLKSSDKIGVDHISNDKLDNRKCNLRLATQSQNNFNIRNGNPNRGVFYDSKKKMWRPCLRVNKIKTYFGSYKTRDEAIKIVMKMEEQFRGEFLSKRMPYQLPSDHPDYKAWK